MLSNSIRIACAMAVVCAAANAWGQAILTHGDTRIGIREDGALNVPDASGHNGAVGLEYLPSALLAQEATDALSPGCWCEAWGVADAISGTGGGTGADTGTDNITVESFTSTATTATSTTNMGGIFRVVHAVSPGAVSGSFRMDVTVTNISGSATELLYRRAMDWDIYPSYFEELVTLYTGGASNIVYTSDDGFADGNPLSGPSFLLFEGEAVDSGPEDHGALFDFNFGTLAAGASRTFTIFYGAAADQAGAMSALAALNAEAYSLGKPDPCTGANRNA